MKRNYRSLFFSGLLFGVCLAGLSKNGSAQPLFRLSISECTFWENHSLDSLPGAQCFALNAPVAALELDSVNRILYLVLDDPRQGNRTDEGELRAYDLNGYSLLWKRPFETDEDYFFLFDTIPVVSRKELSLRLDRRNGNELWSVKYALLKNTGSGNALGYSKFNRMLAGFNLRSGEQIWRKRLDQSNVPSVQMYDDSIAMYFSDGLNYLNLSTGEGFLFRAKTLENKPWNVAVGGTVAVGVFLGGIIGGIIALPLSRTFSNPAGAVSSLTANKLTDIALNDTSIFFPSHDYFYALSHKGKLQWKIPLPGGLVGVRKVFIKDDAVFMINKGEASGPNGQFYSDPSLFKLNLNPVGLMQSIPLNRVEKEYVEDFYLRDSTIVVSLNNSIREVRYSDLAVVKERSFGKQRHNVGLDYILNPPAILRTDSLFQLSTVVCPDAIFVENSNGLKIQFSEDFEPVKVYQEKDYFEIAGHIDPNILISNGETKVLLDEKYQRVLSIDFTAQVKYSDGVFYDFSGDNVLIVPFE